MDIANNINFHFRLNPRKINDQIFHEFQKPYICPIFPICVLCHAQFQMEKTNNPIPRIRLERWTDGSIGKPYSIGPFRLPSGVQIKG